VADGVAYELDSSLVSSKCGEKGVLLIGFLAELFVAAKVPVYANLEENLGALLAVEGFKIRGGFGWRCSSVDYVRGSPTPAAIKLSISSCWKTQTGMYWGVLMPFSSCITSSPCEGTIFASIDTLNR